MRNGILLLWMSSLTLATACGCITGKGEDQKAAEVVKPAPAKLEAARVKADWQEFLVKTLKDAGDEGVEGYGLFSEGGWADAGQVMVLVNKTRAPRLLVVQAGHARVDLDRPLTDAEWKKLKPVLDDSATLETIEVNAFDALVFELAHAAKTPGGVAVDRRMFYCNAGKKQAPRHEALITALQDLKKSPK